MNHKVAKVAEQIKSEIRQRIETNQLDVALAKLDEYGSVFPEDPELYAMKSFVYFQYGDVAEARTILEQAVAKRFVNVDVLYNLAYMYELEQKFLKALDTYETILFQATDKAEQNELLKQLNRFESKYDPQLREELAAAENRSRSGEPFHGRHVHLLYDSPYCGQFIQFVTRHFNSQNHDFLLVGNENEEWRTIDPDTLQLPQVQQILLPKDLNTLIQYLRSGHRIYIHYLLDYICELICRLDIRTNLNWLLWGGDLYNYIDYKMYDALTAATLNKLGYETSSNAQKHTLSYYYRKAAVRRISTIVTTNEGDFAYIRRHFLTAANKVDFFYPNAIPYERLKPSEKSKEENRTIKILVGNSANPSNQHMEMLVMLKKFQHHKIRLVAPLSYGGPDKYTKYIVEYGKSLFGDKFVPILEHMNSDDYFQLLSGMDIALFNHNRQQAFGNILGLLYMGKKVYMNPSSTLFDQLRDSGAYLSDIAAINKESFEEFAAMPPELKNNTVVRERFGEEAAIRLFRELTT